jgi:hypothetical protein
MKPEVLITGFPNSGTSFLCNLIVALGKNPGNYNDLKTADKHNRFGYFENLKIREITYRALGKKHFKPWEKGCLPDSPIEFSPSDLDSYRKQISLIAEQDNVEAYKDNSIPLIYLIFPIDLKYINIRRDPDKAYKSPQKGGHLPTDCTFNEFKIYYQKYQYLVEQMSKEVNCIEIEYESFFNDFERSVAKIAQHIGIHVNERIMAECKKIFRPRKGIKDKVADILNIK